VGWEGLYEVSDLGRVRGVPRTASDGRRLRGRVLKPYLDGRGHYLFVTLSRGAPKICQVHRLVAAAFIGRCPEGQEVRHGPGGKLDNRATELCYGTRAENMADCLRDGTRSYGERRWSAKLTWESVAEIRQRFAGGERQCDLAGEYGVSYTAIYKIVRDKRWRHVS
jgi:hypothetical protein